MGASGYTIETSEGITTIRFEVAPSVDQVRAAFDELTPDCSTLRLWEFCVGYDWSIEEVQRMAAHRNDAIPEPQRVALVAAQDIAFGLSRMYEALREHATFEVRIFRDAEKARAWLRELASA